MKRHLSKPGGRPRPHHGGLRPGSPTPRGNASATVGGKKVTMTTAGPRSRAAPSTS